MKRNIDLTENFDFAMPRRASTTSLRDMSSLFNIAAFTFRGSLGKKIKKNIADIPYCINEDIEHRQRGGLIQGNGYRREFMNIYEEPDSHCERCGCKKEYPWQDFSQLLCPKCSEEFNEGRIPWRN